MPFNPSQFADFIWSIKEIIRDQYAEKEYEDVILPFTLLRRLDCVLESKQEEVDQAYSQYSNLPKEVRDTLLKKASGHNFYNTSGFTLSKLLKVPNDLGENFDAYLKGYSDNIKDILINFTDGEEEKLHYLYSRLLRTELLFDVVKAFTNVDLHPENVSNHEMGTVFEILIRKSKELSNEKAGQYYTPREVVKLLVNLVFSNETEKLKKPGAGIMIYDPCSGTGGLLTEAKEHLLKTVSSDLDVWLYGQEMNEKTYAIAKSDILMKGEDAENIKQGNTITKDKLKGKQFNYMLTNPPFGDDWKNMREFVEEEAALGEQGRFSAGLPGVDDGSFLFLQHMIHKMNPKGSIIGIVFNGSPLFNGDAGGGWSNIRGWILENDLLDTIVALPKDLFYGTNIGTYIWILSNKKPKEREKKVLLINAVHPEFYKGLRKSLGKKQIEISEEGTQTILSLYKSFRACKMVVTGEDSGEKFEKDVALIFDIEDFKYRKVTVERPLRLIYKPSDKQLEELKKHKEFLKLENGNKSHQANELIEALTLLKEDVFLDDSEFFKNLSKHLSFKLTLAWVKILRNIFGVKDEDAKEVYPNPFDFNIRQERPLPDADLRDYENIAWKQDVEIYFENEVQPFVADAWMDRTKDKIGYEIPFAKHFYEYKHPRSINAIMTEINDLEIESEELLEEIKEL